MGRNCEISIRVAVNTQRGFTVTAQALRLGSQFKTASVQVWKQNGHWVRSTLATADIMY